MRKKIRELLRLIKRHDFSIDEAIKFIENHCEVQINEEIKGVDDEIRLNINYVKDWGETVGVGRFDWIHGNISEDHFPLPLDLLGKRVGVFCKLFIFSYALSSEEVEFKISESAYRPGTLFELSVLVDYLKRINKLPIIALGSSWKSLGEGKRVPYLCFKEDKRGLNLGWFSKIYPAKSCYFLAVRYQGKE